MPVQKNACPNEPSVHDVHHGSRYMLFAGTKLLQAGSNTGDEVLAIISATGQLSCILLHAWWVSHAADSQKVASKNDSCLDAMAFNVRHGSCGKYLWYVHRCSSAVKRTAQEALKCSDVEWEGPTLGTCCVGMSTSKGDLLSEILYPQAMVFKYDEELIVVLLMIFTYAGVCAILSIIIQVVKGANSDWVTKWWENFPQTSLVILEMSHALQRRPKHLRSCWHLLLILELRLAETAF